MKVNTYRVQYETGVGTTIETTVFASSDTNAELIGLDQIADELNLSPYAIDRLACVFVALIDKDVL